MQHGSLNERCARAAMVLIGVMTLTGCQVTPSIWPDPRPIPQAPADARADAIVMMLGVSPRDTNGNGYPDLIAATTYLFDRRYSPPLYQAGSLIFELYPPGDAGRAGVEPLRTWRYDAESAAKARRSSGFGPCYRFRLSLLDDGGSDEIHFRTADMVCRFEPADGSAPSVRSEVSTLQMASVLVPELSWIEHQDPAETDSTRLEVWP